MLVCINEDKDNRQLAPGVNQMTRLDPLASQKSGNGVEGARREDVLVMQIIQDGHVQCPPLPLVRLIQIDRD